ncbi:MAG: Rieske 2Fe-2S domain-containing protein [Sandaracinus sp.]|nr:Rieske 2Fe-2S domain-containing protein [Myxococcales bacterium]MCB9601578.1 Rieske 2Fe-2S domain-containing protein [Sandaracinus sp.]MCB9615132.1 Rieske 2Fe-2S domain-containing protein [Sandaracinus sp.]
MSDELARVALSALADGALVRVKHPPFDVVVGLDGEGRPFAIEDACPHSGASLSEGCVRGEVLVCPMHEWEIDVRSGLVRTAVGRGASSPVYDVAVEGDVVVVSTRE